MSVPLDDKRSAPDVAIAGGGVIGMSIAWRAAQAGLEVVLVDAGSLAPAATNVAAGMLAPVTEAEFGEQDLTALNVEAARRFTDFAQEVEAESSRSTGYHRTGTLSVAVDRDQAEALDRMHRYRLSLGLDAERLSGRECRALEPALAPRVLGGVLAAGDHSVDPRALAEALHAALSRAGVRTVAARAASVAVRGDRATGLRLDDGSEVAAAAVVIAAGAGSAAIGGLPETARVPVRPVKGQILRLRATALAPQPLSRVLRTEAVYAVPRADGTLVVGATVEERGFDTAVTAGAVLDLLREAYDVVPGVAELELAEAGAGLRPTAPDNRPVVGEAALDGLVWATGHWRNGILLAPVTADAVVAVLTGEPLPASWERFTPRRFAGSPQSASAIA
jgi:glycine oxidase